MSVRCLADSHLQPQEFAFTAENRAWADQQLAKYPVGRQPTLGSLDIVFGEVDR